MATSENTASQDSEVDQVVNRWIVDYYLSYGFKLFETGQDEDLKAISSILSSIPDYPLEANDTIQKKWRLLQFLSRISEGESLDTSFDADRLISPLESALSLLDHINQEFNIPLQDFENVSTSLKEMIMVIFIKNDEFQKAKEALSKLFLKANVGKKAVFMGLIKQKSKAHKVIEESDFKQFKEEMLDFCQRLCPSKTPFLCRAAQVFIEKRQLVLDDETADSDEQEVPGQTVSASPPRNEDQSGPSRSKILSKARLEQAYTALSAGTNNMTFTQLEEEVEREAQEQGVSSPLSPAPTTSQDVEQDQVFQRDADSPMEATPADQLPQTEADPQTQAGSHSEVPLVRRTRGSYTIARLVMEPDSQSSSQCTTASQDEEDVEETTEEAPPDPPAEEARRHSEMDSEVTEPTQKRPRRATGTCNRSSSSAQSLSENEEESSFSEEILSRKSKWLHMSPRRSLRQLSSKSPVVKSPAQMPQKQPQKPPSSNTPHRQGERDPGSAVVVLNTSLDTSPRSVSVKSSTPGKDSTPGKTTTKWKKLFNNAKESKETWNDEDSYFPSNKDLHNESSSSSHSGHKKQKWTEEESQKLKDGVKRFGEGSWSQIKAYYGFRERTNVNLKDRWRTMKKLKMV